MIKLHFAPPVGDPDWDAWVASCTTSRDALLASDEPSPARLVKDDLYKAQRDRFLEASAKKCAYCELGIAPGQRKGDVEHYRPKGAVKRRDGTLVTIHQDGQPVKHPGYYWLAYSWENLLPSCLACNRPGTDAASGVVTGKANTFPQLNAVWASGPDDLDQEDPALLNPWFDDPADHLEFDTTTGIVGYKSTLR